MKIPRFYGRIWNPPLRVDTLILFRRGAFYMLPFTMKFANKSLFFVEMENFCFTGCRGANPYRMMSGLFRRAGACSRRPLKSKAVSDFRRTRLLLISRFLFHLQQNVFAGTQAFAQECRRVPPSILHF